MHELWGGGGGVVFFFTELSYLQKHFLSYCLILPWRYISFLVWVFLFCFLFFFLPCYFYPLLHFYKGFLLSLLSRLFTGRNLVLQTLSLTLLDIPYPQL